MPHPTLQDQFLLRPDITYLNFGSFGACPRPIFDLILVTNPSYAVNIIAKSLDLKAGDEVLATEWEYGACDRTWQYYCDKVGAKYIKHPIRLPVPTSFISAA